MPRPRLLQEKEGLQSSGGHSQDLKEGTTVGEEDEESWLMGHQLHRAQGSYQGLRGRNGPQTEWPDMQNWRSLSLLRDPDLQG